MKLIPKDAVLAEIERGLHFDKSWIEGDERRQKRTHCKSSAYYKRVGSKHCGEAFLDFVNSLEVTEVDLEKEFRSFLDDIEGMPRMWHSDEQLEFGLDIAKHFFELGLRASNPLTWKDLATIEKLGDDFIKQNHTPMSDEEFYKEILKRFKEQKGE